MTRRQLKIVVLGGLSGALSAILIKEVVLGGNLTDRLLMAAEADPLKMLVVLVLSLIGMMVAWIGLAFTVAGIARRKGYPPRKWFLMALLGGLVTLSAAMAMDDLTGGTANA